MAATIQDAIMLLGDSITQGGFENNGFAARLANAYMRKMDVVNRGYSGYNTNWIIPVFEQCFATQHEQQHVPKVRILTIWFGANDAALPPSPQHVPLEQYQSNLAKLIRTVRSPDSPRYSPETRIILLTPPPVDPTRWARTLEETVEVGLRGLFQRTFEVTRQYAEAARDVGARESVPVVDVWTGIWEAAGRDMGRLGEYLYDGLHLNEKGYAVVYDALISSIAEKYPEYRYDKLPNAVIEFKDIFSDPSKLYDITANPEKYWHLTTINKQSVPADPISSST
ncbi:SGNH hydrolase [Cubamyces sp. BRFM 1775]|nr:SGNH hydrolase [Cubamyces sp. BRFM 1775]